MISLPVGNVRLLRLAGTRNLGKQTRNSIHDMDQMAKHMIICSWEIMTAMSNRPRVAKRADIYPSRPAY